MTHPQQQLIDAAEMLWVVLANVSGGDWTKQSPDWQEAAARWRDNYFAALSAGAVPQPCVVNPVSSRMCERGTKSCVVQHGAVPQQEPQKPGAVGDLRAYGEEEATNALKRKDRDQYQFWQGWNAALDRVKSPAVPALPAPQEQD